jgi:hypothetical protein
VIPGSGDKTIIVVSDHGKLARALEVNLGLLQGVEVLVSIVGKSQLLFAPVAGEEERHWTWQVARRTDLIVVAMACSLEGSPAAMARWRLLDRIRHVPLLVISDCPSHSIPEINGAHLDFPFEAEDLQKTVLELL